MSERDPAEVAIDAAIAVVVSEEGAWATLTGAPEAGEFEPWAAMDALFAALDKARPSWRATALETGRG